MSNAQYLASLVNSSGNINIPVSNAGVVFNNSSATVNSTLNDYETGTYTPAFGGAGGNPTVTYSKQKGYYTKIGNRVFFSIDMAWTAFSGGSGTLTISLPFATNTNYLGSGFNVGFIQSGAFSVNTVCGYNDSGNSTFYLVSSTALSTTVTTGNVSNGSYEITISGNYSAQF